MTSARLTMIALSATVFCTGCEMTPTTPQEDPMVQRLEDIDRRLSALERVIANGSLAELTVQVDQLERQMAGILGRTETLEYQSQGSSSRQRDLYVDLDDRIQALEQALSNAPPALTDDGLLLPGQLPVPGGTDRDNYTAAFELLKEQSYEAAGMAFQQFLVSFPDSQLTANAQYWLAESYYVTGKFGEALQEFEVVISDYPRSSKLPDALLKIGYSNYELQQFGAARTALTKVRDDFSDSTAARLAEQRLQRMTDEGH